MKTIMPTNDQKKMLAKLLAGGLSLSAAISGVFLTAPHEGKRNQSYIDPVGVVTACYGHTGSDVKINTYYPDWQCFEWLAKDLKSEEEAVDRVIHVPLNLYQKAALIDFTHNLGETKLRNSTMAKEFNKKNYAVGCQQLIAWVYAGKKKLPGLEERRQEEMDFCLNKVEIDGV